MNERFKTFADEIADLKLDSFNSKEKLKQTKFALNTKTEQVKELEEELK